jgi:hypothetical protein
VPKLNLNNVNVHSTKRFKLRLSLFDKNILGFWGSKTTNGFSLGPFIPKGQEPYHLTFFRKQGFVNAHLTIGYEPNVNYVDILKFTADEFDRKLQSIISSLERSIIVTEIRPQKKVFYLGNRLLDLVNSDIVTTSYKGKTEIQNFQLDEVVNRLPNLIYEIREDPKAFFGLAKMQDIIKNPNIVGGFTNDGQFFFLDEDQPLTLATRPITKWSTGLFNTLNNIFPPIYELVGMFGVPQLFNEIQQRKTFKV